jgi:hypothetical protein
MTAVTPGDDLVPDANLVLVQTHHLGATAEAIWPWLVQLGKRRAGWYLPAIVERVIPRGHRAIHHVDERFQHVAIGDRIPDYGGRDEWLEVALVQPPHVLAYWSERRGRRFSWTLVLTDDGSADSSLTLSFRGRLHSRGLTRRAVSAGAWFADRLTGELMVRGLRERLAATSRANVRSG